MEYRIASKDDIELLMSSRLEMLRIVNDLPDDYVYSDGMISNSRRYFLEGDHTTVIVLDGDRVVACASICYIEIMPTFSHPGGKRAHLMNVYTSQKYRRQGIAKRMVSMLIKDAWERGATEISLDATQEGRPLYEKCGFVPSDECMVLVKQ